MAREEKNPDKTGKTQSGHNREFMRETVTHKSGRRKKIKKVAVLILSAIVFGVLAALTMVFSSDIIHRITTASPTEDLFVLEDVQAPDGEDETQNEPVAEPGAVLTIEDLDASNAAVREFVSEISRGIVSVRADAENNGGGEGFLSGHIEVPGILWSSTPRTAFILVDYTEMMDCEQFSVKLSTGTTVLGSLRAADRTTGLAVIGIDHDAVTAAGLEEAFAELGHNNSVGMLDWVIALGAPYGRVGSEGIGRVTFLDRRVPAVDGEFDCIITDMHMSGSAFLIDLSGEIVGISTSNMRNGDESTFYGAGSLRDILERLANGRDLALLGVSGRGVTTEMAGEGVPTGVYVESVLRNGPAYDAGIMAGDVITQINSEHISTTGGLQNVLFSITAGSAVRVTVARPVRGGYSEQNITVTTTNR